MGYKGGVRRLGSVKRNEKVHGLVREARSGQKDQIYKATAQKAGQDK